MASRAQEKERLRRERIAREQEEARRPARAGRLRLGAGGGIALIAVAAVAVAVASSGGSGGSRSSSSAPPPKLSQAEARSLPHQIAANIRQANQVIDTSVQDKLASLRGVPVVVNQWASWCPNCKFEFPFFQHLAQRYRNQVAFLGLDSQDSKGNAADFLRGHPVDYPSVFDQSAAQAASLGGGQAWPTTFFFNAAGERVYVHVGAYASEQALAADIKRYANPSRS
jgi:thiol-disulfide isomerase/thioredoxin